MSNAFGPCNCPPFVGGCVCSLTETFNRTLAGGWGLSEIDNLPFSGSFQTLLSVTPGNAAYAGHTVQRQTTMFLPNDSVRTLPFEVLYKITVPSGPDNDIVWVAVEDPDYAHVLVSRASGGTLTFSGYYYNGGTPATPVVTGQLSGYAGVPFYLRFQYGQTVRFKAWFASASEPGAWLAEDTLGGTSEPPGQLDFIFPTTSSPVSFQSLQIVSGYDCGGRYVGGTVSERYRVYNKTINHSGDAAYVALGGWRSTTLFRISGPNFYESWSDQVGITPSNLSAGSVAPATSISQWLIIDGRPGGYVRFKVGGFNASLGTSAGLGSIGVGVFVDLGQPLPGTPVSHYVAPSGPEVSFAPIAVLALDEWYETRGQVVYITPWPLSRPSFPLPAGSEIYWANYGGDASYYSPTKPAQPYGDPFSRSSGAYEPHVVTLELAPGAVWAPCVTGTPVRNQSVRDELVGAGDGVTTVFTTIYPYVPNSLMVFVSGLLVEADPTNPGTGAFTLIPAPVLDSPIGVTYKAA